MVQQRRFLLLLTFVGCVSIPKRDVAPPEEAFAEAARLQLTHLPAYRSLDATLQPAAAATMRDLRRRNERPVEWFVSLGLSEDSLQVDVNLWHMSGLRADTRFILGNPSGRDHSLRYDRRSGKVTMLGLWQ